jgi:alkylhydroperoxidase family enzyme
VARAGRVYQIVRAMSLWPEVLDPAMELYVAVMRGESPLSRARREMLAVVVSRANDCHY